MDQIDSFLEQIGAALAILFLVAVATEILIETIRGVLSGLFRGRFDSPFFTRQTEFSDALKSVQDMLPKKTDDQLLMVARLEDAFQKAKTLSEGKASAVKSLVEKATEAADAFQAKEAIHSALAKVVADVELNQRQRAVVLKTLAGVTGVLLCTSGGINAFAEIASSEIEMLGPVLTGVAAAGGSTFWHDQIERVRAVRNTVGAAKKVADTA